MSQARVEPPSCYWIWGTRFPVDAPSSDRRGPHRARHHRLPPPRPDPSRRMVCGVENMEAPPLRRGTPYPVTYNVVSYNGGYLASLFVASGRVFSPVHPGRCQSPCGAGICETSYWSGALPALGQRSGQADPSRIGRAKRSPS